MALLINTIALSGDAIALSAATIALSVDAIALLADTIEFSVDAIELSVDTIALRPIEVSNINLLCKMQALTKEYEAYWWEDLLSARLRLFGLAPNQ